MRAFLRIPGLGETDAGWNGDEPELVSALNAPLPLARPLPPRGPDLSLHPHLPHRRTALSHQRRRATPGLGPSRVAAVPGSAEN